jgi:hypothetical protein
VSSPVGGTLPVIFCVCPCSYSNLSGARMELAERIANRAAELAGEVEQLRRQLADAERELERLVIAGQVITQLTADGTAGGESAGAGPAHLACWPPDNHALVQRAVFGMSGRLDEHGADQPVLHGSSWSH